MISWVRNLLSAGILAALCIFSVEPACAASGMTPKEEAFIRQVYLNRTSTWDLAYINAAHWTNFHKTYSNTIYSLLSNGVTNFSYSYGAADSISQTGHTGYFVFNTNVAPYNALAIATYGSNTALAVSNLVAGFSTNSWDASTNVANWSSNGVVLISNTVFNLPTNNWNTIGAVSNEATFGSNTAVAVSNMWDNGTNAFARTNDSRDISLQGNFHATNAVPIFYKAYQGNTSDVFEANQLITADAVDKRLQAFASEIWYGTTNVHPVLAGTSSAESIEPTNSWYSTNSLAVGTNLLGVFASTNTLYSNRVPAGEYLGHFHCQVIKGGMPIVETFFKLATITTDGATTNILDTTSKKDVSDATTLGEFDLRAHVSTNVYYSEARYLAVLRYGVRTGGASASLVTAGGGGLSTSLRTPNISYSSTALEAYYTSIWASNGVVNASNRINSISVGSVTNGSSGIWELSEDLTTLYTLAKPQAWSAGLWMVNEDGSVSPSGADSYDTLWTTNTAGDISPR